MKIIGTKPDGFIVEISAKELHRIQGYYSEYGEGRERVANKVGQTFDINEMYEKLRHLEDNKHNVNKCIETLRQYADNLEPLQLQIDQLGEKS